MKEPVRLVLVRHGEAAAEWGELEDPGLSEAGAEQAEAMADALAPIGPLPVVTSPLLRARQTAAALERRWGTVACVEPRLGEVPTDGDELGQRRAWLSAVLRTTWDQWPPALREWRNTVIATLAALGQDTVVVTHFVAIRTASGLQYYTPDYCSRTVVEVDGAGVRLVERGAERPTVVR